MSSDPEEMTSASPPDEEMTSVSPPREAWALGFVFAAIWALPSALRSGSPAVAYLVLTGVTVALVAPLFVLGQKVQDEWRGALSRVAVGVGLAVVPVAVLGVGIHTYTNHRGLGGATFGIVGTMVLAAAVGVAFVFGKDSGGKARRALGLLSALVALVGVLACAALVYVVGSPAARIVLADAGVGVIALILVVRLARRAPGPLRRHGWALAAASLAAAVAVCLARTDFARTLSAEAPLVFWVGAWIGSGA
jgi:choline-sulfatase